MKIGFIGLGKMGLQIVQKVTAAGHEVVAFDVNPQAIIASTKLGARPADSRPDLMRQLGAYPIVWLMIPAEFVAAEFETLLELLPPGATLIDGGNSRYGDSIDRAAKAAAKHIEFIDVGTSGGIMGLRSGFSLMVGGNEHSFKQLEPIFNALTQPAGSYGHMGPAGSGHYVKMVHNGIEYALMQAYAEGYDLLKYGPVEHLRLAEIARVWQHGSIISSTLNGLVAEILKHNGELIGVDGYVADSGEGRWTLETAEASKVPMPALKEALNVRSASQNGYNTFATKLLAALRNAFGGHSINKQG